MTLQIEDKKIWISEEGHFFICEVSGERVAVLSCNLGYRYFILPNHVSVCLKSNGFVLSCNYNVDAGAKFEFLSCMIKWIKESSKLFRSKLLLKGLGYKVNVSDNQKKLNLKLGYSKIRTVLLPTTRIRVKTNKTMITVQGHNLSDVGNFAQKIRRLREPDLYKGKGIWFQNESITLKEIKKK
jgi:large subunit ribosomal protein L6